MNTASNLSYKVRPPSSAIILFAQDLGAGDNGGMEQRVKTLEENMADVRDRLVRIETRLEHTVTKEDLARLAGSTREDITRLAGSTREDITRLEARMEGRFTLLQWMLAVTLAGVGAIFTKLFF